MFKNATSNLKSNGVKIGWINQIELCNIEQIKQIEYPFFE